MRATRRSGDITTDATGAWTSSGTGVVVNRTDFVTRTNPSGYASTNAFNETVTTTIDCNKGFEGPTQGRSRGASDVQREQQVPREAEPAAITFDQSGIPTGVSNDTSTIQVLSVTIGATTPTTTYTAAQLPVTLNTSNGTTVNYTYSDPVASTTTGKRYARGTITGPASGFSASGAQRRRLQHPDPAHSQPAHQQSAPHQRASNATPARRARLTTGANINLLAAIRFFFFFFCPLGFSISRRPRSARPQSARRLQFVGARQARTRGRGAAERRRGIEAIARMGCGPWARHLTSQLAQVKCSWSARLVHAGSISSTRAAFGARRGRTA